jgi:ABC-type Fe3+ transport system substrate-binding protein
VVKSAKSHPAARAYVNYLVSGAGQQVLTARGFLAP